MNKLLRNTEVFFKRNSPTILTCVGAVGVVATSIFVAKAVPKATIRLEKAKEEKGEELTKLEAFKTAAPVYIPAVVTGAATIACIFGANVLSKRQQASLMSAYALLDSSYKDYKNKAIELYGKDADKHIREEIVKDKYEETDISVEDGKQLFYDAYSERYFESTLVDVIKAEYELNKRINTWGGAGLNEFYELLDAPDLPPVDYGEFLGWSAGGMAEMCWETWLDFYHESVVMDDGLECQIITFGVEPVYEYEYY